MNFIKFKKGFFLLSCLFAMLQGPLFAEQVKFKIDLAIPGSNKVTKKRLEVAAIPVTYKVTNLTGITRRLIRVRQTAVAQDPLCMFTPEFAANACQDVFVLAPGQSCNLCLQFLPFDSGVGHFVGGPAVCKVAGDSNLPDPLLCSRATAAEQLDITITN